MKFGRNELIKCTGQLYFIPDVHGELYKLRTLWDKILINLKEEDHIVFLGDYIGNLSRHNIYTLKLLQEIKNHHKNTFFIKGNHDDSFRTWLNSNTKNFFLDKAGLENEVLELGYPSCGKESIKNILIEHKITFLNEMIDYYENDELIATHAPMSDPSRLILNKVRNNEEGILEYMSFELMWDFLNPDSENIPVNGVDKWLICGHQNNFNKRLVPSVYIESKRIFLDCGVGYNKDALLYCFKFPQKTWLVSDK